MEVAAVAEVDAGKDSNQLMAAHLLEQSEAYLGQLAELKKLRARKLAILDTIPEVMVMEEMAESRQAYVLERGEYNSPGKKVAPGPRKKYSHFPTACHQTDWGWPGGFSAMPIR